MPGAMREFFKYERADVEKEIEARTNKRAQWLECGCGCDSGVAWGKNDFTGVVWIAFDKVPVEQVGAGIIGFENPMELEMLRAVAEEIPSSATHTFNHWFNVLAAAF